MNEFRRNYTKYIAVAATERLLVTAGDELIEILAGKKVTDSGAYPREMVEMFLRGDEDIHAGRGTELSSEELGKRLGL